MIRFEDIPPKPRTKRQASPRATEIPTRAKAAPGRDNPSTEGRHMTRMNPLDRPVTPSAALAAVVGPEADSRPQIVSRLWAYIKQQNLQNPANKREILADEKLGVVFGKEKVTMFEMNKLLSPHLTS